MLCSGPAPSPFLYIAMTEFDPELAHVLAQAAQQEQRLNRMTWVVAVVLALFSSLLAANQNLYSVAATFIVALAVFIAGSIYRTSLGWLLPAIALFCVADNYLSHQQQFHQQHFLLQFATLVIFSAMFSLSRPYLYKVLQSLNNK